MNLFPKNYQIGDQFFEKCKKLKFIFSSYQHVIIKVNSSISESNMIRFDKTCQVFLKILEIFYKN